MSFNAEQIDRFLLDQMGSEERQQLLNEAQSDPLLQQELDVQVDINKAISVTREAQLKARLNRIDVPLRVPFYQQPLFQMAASIAAISLITTSLYLGTRGNQMNRQNADNKPANTSSKGIDQTIKPVETIQAPIGQEITNAPSDKSTNTKQTETQVVKNQKKSGKNNEEVVVSPQITLHENPEIQAPQIGMPDDNNADIQSFSSSQVVIADVKHEETKNKTYAFYNDKLFLVGPFKGKTYEVLDVMHNGKRSVYFSFENHFYELKQGQTQHTPMKAVTNPALMEALKNYQSRSK
jgi:hypothetical protein